MELSEILSDCSERMKSSCDFFVEEKLEKRQE